MPYSQPTEKASVAAIMFALKLTKTGMYTPGRLNASLHMSKIRTKKSPWQKHSSFIPKQHLGNWLILTPRPSSHVFRHKQQNRLFYSVFAKPNTSISTSRLKIGLVKSASAH